MAVSLQWHDAQKSALKLTFTAPWTWDDYEQLSPEIEAAMESVEHPVDLVIDLSEAGDLPEQALYHLRNAYSDTSPNRGQYIFLGATDVFKTLFEAVDRHYTALGGELEYQFVEAEQA
jgi:hypothetical protein